jgi:hypothetical protein
MHNTVLATRETTKFTLQVLEWEQHVQAQVVWTTTSVSKWVWARVSKLVMLLPPSSNKRVKWVSCYWKHFAPIKCSCIRNVMVPMQRIFSWTSNYVKVCLSVSSSVVYYISDIWLIGVWCCFVIIEPTMSIVWTRERWCDVLFRRWRISKNWMTPTNTGFPFLPESCRM